MTHVLSITDGTTTVTLTTGNYLLRNYTPDRPRMRDGVYEPVADVIHLYITGASTTAVQDNINAIESLLNLAQLQQRQPFGSKVYLQMQVHGESATWRSEILDGQIELEPIALQAWTTKGAECRLHVKRKHYWEDTTLRTVSSSTVPNNGSGITLSAGVIDGTEETPVELEMTNASGSAKSYHNFYIGNIVADSAGAFEHFQNPTKTYSVTAGNTDTVDYTIDANTCIQGAGRFCNVISRVTGITSGTVMCKMTVLDSSALVTIYETEEIQIPANAVNNEIQSLGAIPIPPGGDFASWSAITLRLHIRSVDVSTSGNVTFIMLTPSNQTRHLRQRSLSISNGGTVTDDGIERITHSAGWSIYSTRGNYIRIVPGKSQQLIFIHDTQTGFSTSSDLSVTIKYRPRRLSV